MIDLIALPVFSMTLKFAHKGDDGTITHYSLTHGSMANNSDKTAKEILEEKLGDEVNIISKTVHPQSSKALANVNITDKLSKNAVDILNKKKNTELNDNTTLFSLECREDELPRCYDVFSKHIEDHKDIIVGSIGEPVQIENNDLYGDGHLRHTLIVYVEATDINLVKSIDCSQFIQPPEIKEVLL